MQFQKVEREYSLSAGEAQAVRMPGKPPRVVYEDAEDKYTGITKPL